MWCQRFVLCKMLADRLHRKLLYNFMPQRVLTPRLTPIRESMIQKLGGFLLRITQSMISQHRQLAQSFQWVFHAQRFINQLKSLKGLSSSKSLPTGWTTSSFTELEAEIPWYLTSIPHPAPTFRTSISTEAAKKELQQLNRTAVSLYFALFTILNLY